MLPLHYRAIEELESGWQSHIAESRGDCDSMFGSTGRSRTVIRTAYEAGHLPLIVPCNFAERIDRF